MIDEVLSAVGVKDLADIQEATVTVIGGKTVVVTNMLGILELSDTKIVFKAAKNKNIAILGEYMEVLLLNKHEITIRGRINLVDYKAE